MVSSYFKGSGNEKQSLPFHFSLFSLLLSDTNTLSLQFIIQHGPQWKTVSSPIYTSKRSITRPGLCHHNEILSTCQEAAKVPNKCVAKLSICGFLVWLLQPMGCHSGPWFKKPWGLFAAGSFWKLVALWHPQPSIGPCCCIASYYPELRRIVFGNRMLTFSYGAILQVGPSSSPRAWG